MIISYLRLIEIIEMISRRLTKIQKTEILEAYKAGYNSNSLAEKYSCTTSTILRIVKTLLSDVEYKLLKEERSKSSNKQGKSFDYQNLKEKDLSIESDEDSEDPEIEQISTLSLDNNNHFELIAPLLSQFGVDEVKPKSDYEILDFRSLPESVYMIVDKKVELDYQLISDLPEWSFLPENELKRYAIVLFSNQRSAKRSCLKNQRVIKIPNTDIFKLSKSYLISKGITRLILEDTIMALD